MSDLTPVTVVDDDEGQTTAEYALVIAAVAVVVGGLITWASGSGAIEGLFTTVLDRLTAAVGG
ncbi:MAG: DUF4244 domain-containing protein [Actinomycetota bacterium]